MSLTPEQFKVWTDLIDWLTTLEAFVIIGDKDGQITARSSIELDDAYEMVSLVADMLANSLESGASDSLQTLQ